MDEEERKALKQCHWGNKFVFRWRDLNFFGAGSFRGLDTSASGIDVIIDCGADVSQNTADIYMAKGLAPTQPIQIISINWPDGGSPTLTKKNWLSLIKKLEKIKLHCNRGQLNILVCCIGGHGRTGTALDRLSALTGIEPESPVEFIRKEYCRKAVETKSQCRYIKKIAGIALEDDLPLPDSDIACESSLRY